MHSIDGIPMEPPEPTGPVWIMRTKDGWYPIHASEDCKPEDHGELNGHVIQIEDVEGNVLWRRDVQ